MFTDPTRIKMTDPGHPESCNVCHYWEVFAPAEAPKVWEECRTSKRGCTQNKQELAERIVKITDRFRDERRKLPEGEVDKILAEGAARAKAVASETMRQVKQAVGLS